MKTARATKGFHRIRLNILPALYSSTQQFLGRRLLARLGGAQEFGLRLRGRYGGAQQGLFCREKVVIVNCKKADILNGPATSVRLQTQPRENEQKKQELPTFKQIVPMPDNKIRRHGFSASNVTEYTQGGSVHHE